MSKVYSVLVQLLLLLHKQTIRTHICDCISPYNLRCSTQYLIPVIWYVDADLMYEPLNSVPEVKQMLQTHLSKPYWILKHRKHPVVL